MYTFIPTYLAFSHVMLKTSWTVPRNKGKYISIYIYTYTNYSNQTNMLIAVDLMRFYVEYINNI